MTALDAAAGRRFLVLAGALSLLALLPATSSAQGTVTRPRTATTSPAVAQPATYVEEFGTMWTFDAPPLEHWRATYGFAPDQQWLDRVRLSAVRIPGCSASFVSANGLVLTNHHCARACVAAVSPRDTNYVEAGFAAPALSDEKQCPAMWADQLQSIEDVTARVRGAMKSRVSTEQVAQRDAEIERIQQSCTADTKLNCQVIAFYQGGRYSLYRFRRFDDVRLVLAPEVGIAFFGGDPDNFTYPRYDLDATLLRVYDNGQPLRPAEHLRWSTAGAREDEPVFIVGNPGSTGRLNTLAQLEYLRDVQYPAALRQYERMLAAWRAAGAVDPAKARLYQNRIYSYQNAHKAVGGYLRGLSDSTLLAKKRAFERDFRGRISREPKLEAKYGTAWNAIAAAQRGLTAMALQSRYLGYGGGSQLLMLAGDLVRLPVQAALPDSLRIATFRGAGLAKTRASLLDTAAVVDTMVERLVLTDYLAAAKRELPANDPFLARALAGRTPAAAAEALVRGTRIGDVAERRALVEGGTAAVNASDDPLVALARWIEPINRRVTARSERLSATISTNAERVGEAIFAAYGTALPPDATFSLRISDGIVKGYAMNGTLAPWKTTFHGLYDRSASFDGAPPFHLPPRWNDPARRARLKMDTPFNFVSTNDIIGGNSGSPVINRAGEVVGLVFDGNIEQLPTRFVFTTEGARSVSVHSQGLLEALRVMYDAGRIVEELTK